MLEVVTRFNDRSKITEVIPGEREMTQREWSDARSSLINRGLLDRIGALTKAGRRAMGVDDDT